MIAGSKLMVVNPALLNCIACPLCKLRKQVVVGEGPVPSNIMIVGEGPGPQENDKGTPFIRTAPAGSRLINLLQLAGINRDDVFLSNVVHCLPTDDGKNFRPPHKDEKEACASWLAEEIAKVSPEIILALGDHALKAFLPTATIKNAHGKAFMVDGRVVIPLYHPSYYNRMQYDTATRLKIATDYKNIFKSVKSLVQTPNFRWKLLQPKRLSQVEDFCNYLMTSQCWAFDMETTGFDPWLDKVLGISFSNGTNTYYLDITNLEDTAVLKLLLPLFKSSTIRKRGANLKFEGKILIAKTGDADPLHNFDDSMLLAYILHEESLGLKEGVLRNLGVKMTDIKDLLGTGKKKRSMSDVSIEEISPYGAADSFYVYRLIDHYLSRLSKTESRIYYEIDLPLVMPLARMEVKGAPVDEAYLQTIGKPMEEELEKIRQQLFELAGGEFNPNADADIRKLLFSDMHLRSRKRTKKKKQLSTDKAVLQKLKNDIENGGLIEDNRALPFLSGLLSYKELHKLTSTYLKNLKVHPVTGNAHTEFKQASTVTARLSSGAAEETSGGGGDLNFQNIPIRTKIGKAIRKAFIAPPGWLFLKGDASQEELRLLAHFSEDKTLVLAYNSRTDIHDNTSNNIVLKYKPYLSPEDARDLAKIVNFSVIYGTEPPGLAQNLGCTPKEASSIIRDMYTLYPGIKDYERMVEAQLAKYGYIIGITGRKIPLVGYFSRNADEKRETLKLARNYKIQNGGGEIIRMATAVVDNYILANQLESWIHLQVHDELCLIVRPWEVHRLAAVVRNALSPDILRVPLETKILIGRNWVELESYNTNIDYTEYERRLRHEAA